MRKNVEAAKKKSSFYYITILQVLSALAVILLHANNSFWVYRDGKTWYFNTIIESVFYFAVPIFFMITGATLIDYQDRYDTKTFFKRRFSKVLIPFIFWSLFGLLFYSLRGYQFNFDPLSIYNNIMEHGYVSIFWFFIPLICIYLSIPLFAAVDKNKKVKIFKYLAFLGIILNCAIPFLVNCFSYVFHKKVALGIEVGVVSGYLIFPIVGYLLHNIELSKKKRYTIYAIAVISLVIHIVGTIIVSKHAGHIDKLFKGYTNLPSILYSIGIFVFIKYSEKTAFFQKLKKPITRIAKYTFALYLVHHFVIVQLSDFLASYGITGTTLIYVPIMFILATVISIVIIWLIRKIPLGKQLLP